jgi:predicted transcriptional regulator
MPLTDDAGRTLNDTEWALLEALWERGRGTAREVADHVRAERDWHVSTVKTLLDRMVTKGLVRARRVGNVWEYEPAVEPVAARRAAWRRFVSAAFGGAMEPALRFIAEDAKLSAAERRALRKLLEGDAK